MFSLPLKDLKDLKSHLSPCRLIVICCQNENTLYKLVYIAFTKHLIFHSVIYLYIDIFSRLAYKSSDIAVINHGLFFSY
jgi:hypothetical protein